MNMIRKIKNKKDMLYSYMIKNTQKPKITNFIHFLWCKYRYCIDVQEYVDNRLFDRRINHDSFYMNNHVVVHKWKYVVKNYCSEKNKCWLFFRWIDYRFSKLLYPGLDAMDYFRYEFYNYRHSKRKTFITEGGLKKLNKAFNNESKYKEKVLLLNNKAKFNEYFKDYLSREWMISNGITYDDFSEFCEKHNKIICKPLMGAQGKGIFIKEINSNSEAKFLYDDIKNKDYLLEEVLVQHERINYICPKSVNTLRVYSVVSHSGDIVITGAVIRFGDGTSDTDNYSSGGLAATIDVESGIVISRAINQYGDSAYVHPKTKKTIIGLEIPCWDNVKNTVLLAHEKIKELRYIGWDIVVCKDEKIAILEANTFSGVALQQHPSLIGKKFLYDSLL